MKFKAFLTVNGVNLLERRFVPAFDKIGRVCHLYLTRDHVILLHNVLNADGVQAIAQFKKEVLFDEYRISSQNDDRIAFTVDLALLLRALKSSVSMDGEKLQVKLVKKRPIAAERPMPYLTFESKGYKSAIIQDVPVSNPLSRVEVHELQSALDMAQDLPQTLVQVPDLLQLQSLVDRLKNVGEVLDVAITQHGDFHLQVCTTFVTVGSEYSRLRVVGVRGLCKSSDLFSRQLGALLFIHNCSSTHWLTSVGDNLSSCLFSNSPLDESISSSARLERALQRGEASSVQVSIKHFAKSIQCYMTRPDAAFYGIASEGACLTVIFQFFIPGTRQTDNSISLHCRLPVLDPGLT